MGYGATERRDPSRRFFSFPLIFFDDHYAVFHVSHVVIFHTHARAHLLGGQNHPDVQAAILAAGATMRRVGMLHVE